MDLNSNVTINQVQGFKENEEKAALEDIKIEIADKEEALKEAMEGQWGNCEICVKLGVREPQLATFVCNFEDKWCCKKEWIEGCNRKCCLDHMYEND